MQQLDSNMLFASTILFSSSHKLKNVIDEQRSAAFAVMFLAWSSGSFNSAMAHATEPPCLASLSMTMIPWKTGQFGKHSNQILATYTRICFPDAWHQGAWAVASLLPCMALMVAQGVLTHVRRSGSSRNHWCVQTPSLAFWFFVLLVEVVDALMG